MLIWREPIGRPPTTQLPQPTGRTKASLSRRPRGRCFFGWNNNAFNLASRSYFFRFAWSYKNKAYARRNEIPIEDAEIFSLGALPERSFLTAFARGCFRLWSWLGPACKHVDHNFGPKPISEPFPVFGDFALVEDQLTSTTWNHFHFPGVHLLWFSSAVQNVQQQRLFILYCDALTMSEKFLNAIL